MQEDWALDCGRSGEHLSISLMPRSAPVGICPPKLAAWPALPEAKDTFDHFFSFVFQTPRSRLQGARGISAFRDPGPMMQALTVERLLLVELARV